MIKKFNNYLNENHNISLNRENKIKFILDNQDKITDEVGAFPYYTEELDIMSDHHLTLCYTELKNLLHEQSVEIDEEINESKKEIIDILRINKYIDFDDLKGFIQKIDNNFVYIYDITKDIKEDIIVKITIKDFIKKFNKYSKNNI